MRSLRLALAQINTTVGDFAGNLERISAYMEQARAVGADVVAFPELAVTGYPPEDLLLQTHFVDENLRTLERLAGRCRGITAVVGFVDEATDLFNAAAVLHDGRVAGVVHKEYLPTYGVFDEDRYFRPGQRSAVFRLGAVTFGVNVCEDIWYPTGPMVAQANAGAELIVNINASPYHRGKLAFRRTMLATRAADHAAFVAYVNLVGGQDELVFDGGSMVLGPRGELVAQAAQFAEELLVVDIDLDDALRTRLQDPRRRKARWQDGAGVAHVALAPHEHAARPPIAARLAPPLAPCAEVYEALKIGLHDYVRKNGFQTVVVGLSGGIDSALTATIAADALGPASVVGVSMPSRYSSASSRDDAAALAANLRIRYLTLPIEPAFAAMLQSLAPAFGEAPPNVAEENLQSRIRGNFLMALSNKFGWLVVTTGNKSEMATGYATLYGDMAGGFALIKDVPKTLVYELARYRNAISPVIPEAILTKEPSAELRPDQRDTDTLPPYAVLDPLLELYVEEERSIDEIVARGFERSVVERVALMVDRSEYKRRQAPPGVKITPRAFGRDRRLPITNRYRRP
jgi:NAD+ synthase (glutamine-hydrolysing)